MTLDTFLKQIASINNDLFFNKKISINEVKEIIKKSFLPFEQDPLLSYSVDFAPKNYTVVAIDGSRSLADHHSGIPYTLILISSVLISYGINSRYSVSMYPSVYKDEAGYDSESNARSIQLNAELEIAAKIEKNFNRDELMVVLLDGSIVQNKKYNVSSSIATYTSAARHVSISNRITDGLLFQIFLSPFTRSAWWHDSKKDLFICYFKSSFECSRIEVSEKCLIKRDRILSCIVDQIKRGGGYPLALYYAHNYTRSIKEYKVLCEFKIKGEHSLKGITKFF